MSTRGPTPRRREFDDLVVRDVGMSVQSDPGDDSDPSIFVARIQQNRDVCSNCFRRTHVTYRLTHRYTTYDGDLVCERVDSTAYPKPRRPQKDTTVRTVYPDEISARCHETNACPCGMFSNYATIRPIDKREMIEHGGRLVAEYERQGLLVDEDEFFDTLRELKSDPDRQFEDDSIFEEATSRAVREPGQIKT